MASNRESTLQTIIYKASANDISHIKQIADQVWVQHYSKIISKEQVDYMYPLMYSETSLHEQMKRGDQFFICSQNDIGLGFISMQIVNQLVKIPKLYVSTDAQGMGIGKKLIHQAISEAKQAEINCIELNVNRFNTESIAFYKKLGFIIKESVDIPLDRFLLEDYIMRLTF